MLNRLFVIIGLVVILAIGGAFLVPRFIQWGDYRTRLEAMAGKAFGTDVAIEGDIQLTLLPEPQLQFTKVRIGPKAAPVMAVDKVEANFSLVDFLSDRYKVTRLQLDHPAVNFAIDASGRLASGIAVAPGGEQSNVSIADADVVGGTISVADARSGETYVADAIAGKLKLEALKGPFSFQGEANFGGNGYGLRLSSGPLDDKGAATVSVFVKAADDSFSVQSNGTLQSGAAPKFTGDLSYRHPPPKPKKGDTIDVGRGDFVLTGKLEAAVDRVLLTEYTVLPDENRAATRLTGAGELKLGKGMAFNAIVSGAVLALPPRDATTELTDPPYELVRLLGETPLPPIPPIPGTIGLDIAELNLRAVSLRDLRLDAETDAKSWAIKDFGATLPGGTKVGLTGNLSIVDGHSIFAGGVTLATDRLDLLASLWRKPADNDPLFNMPGSLSADVALSSDALTLSSGTFVVAGINQGFDATIGFGAQRSLKLDTHFTTLGPDESAAIAALMPDVAGNGSFGATFPKGQVDLSASKAVLFGLDGTGLAATATWEGGVLEFSKLSAADLGGAAFDGKLTAFGTLMKPELSGAAKLKIEDGAPIVASLLNAVSTPPAVADFLRRSLPADLTLQLEAPSGQGGQTLKASGKLATADLTLEARLGAGIANALTAPLKATLDLSSGSATLMTTQLGLGDAAIFDDRTPLHLVASVEGVPSNSYEAHLTLQGGEDHIGFAGNIIPGDFTKIAGNGDIDARLADPSALVAALGAAGVYLPAIEGKGHLDFTGLDQMELSRIEAAGITGDLTLSRRGDTAGISGALSLPSLEARALLPALAGASSTIAGPDSVWPEGPIDIGGAPRTTNGRIDVSVANLTNNGAPLLKDASFGLDWDARSVHLRGLKGAIGGGTFSLDATVCCSNAALASKQISGRLGLDGVAVDAVVPGAIGAQLDGTVSAAASFDGSGETVGQAIAGMTGTGNYTVSNLEAAHFDPAVFKGAGALVGVVDMTPEALVQAVTGELAAAPFAAPSVTGSFNIAGGILRSPNLAITGTDAQIFGGASLALPTLTLDARYAMSPVGTADPASAVDPTTAEVAAVIQGPLWAPVTSYDVSALTDGMKIKASEVELARLEKLQAEDEARQKAAAAEQARLAAEQAAAEAAKAAAAQAAADAAAKQAALDEAARKAAADIAAKKAASDLGL